MPSGRFGFRSRVLGRGKPKSGGTPTPTPSAGVIVDRALYGKTAGYDAGIIGDWFVNPVTGSDTNAGTVGAPFQTIQKAVTTAVSGQKIKLRGGIYSEMVVVGKELDISAYGTELPVWSGGVNLTGMTRCTSADFADVGSNFASLFKTGAIAKSNFVQGSMHSSMLTENDFPLNLAQRRADTTDLFEQANTDAYYRGGTLSNGDGVVFTLYNSSGSRYDVDTVRMPGVTDTYTDQQLRRMSVGIKGASNEFETCPVDPSTATGNGTIVCLRNSNGNTVQPDYYTSDGLSGEWYFNLMNALPSIRQGEWGYIDSNPGEVGVGTITFYVWPNSEANIGNIKAAARSNCVRITRGNVRLAGIRFCQTTSDGAGSAGVTGQTNGSPIQAVTNFTGSGPVIIEQNEIINCSNRVKGQGALYSYGNDGLIFRYNFVNYMQNQYGPAMQANSTPAARKDSGNRVYRNYIKKSAQSPVRSSAQWNYAVYDNLFEDCGLAAHANKANFYQYCKNVLCMRNVWINCGGYLTPQLSTSFLFLNNFCPQDPKGVDGRAFNDQTGGSPATLETGSQNYLIGNFFGKAPDNVGSASSIRMDADNAYQLQWYVYNNIGTSIARTSDDVEDYNIFTKAGSYNFNTETIEDDTKLYNSLLNSDYLTFPNSVLRTKAGKDVTSIIQQWEASFSDVNLRLTLDGKPWNPGDPGVGPWGRNNWPMASDTVAPIVNSLQIDVAGRTAVLQINTSKDGGLVKWVRLASGATVPSAAQVAAGQTATGLTAPASGSFWASKAGRRPTTFTAANVSSRIAAVQVDRFGNLSNVLTQDVTFGAYVPYFADFTNNRLNRSIPLVGAQATTREFLLAYSIRRSTLTGASGGILSTLPLTPANVIDANTNGARHKFKSTTGSLIFDRSITPSQVADVPYLVLVSYKSIAGGSYSGNVISVNVNDGSRGSSTSATGSDALVTFANTSQFLVFATALQSERLMLWENTSADATSAAVQQLFVGDSGGFVDPQAAIDAIGQPTIAMFAYTMPLGINLGFGGDFLYYPNP